MGSGREVLSAQNIELGEVSTEKDNLVKTQRDVVMSHIDIWGKRTALKITLRTRHYSPKKTEVQRN